MTRLAAVVALFALLLTGCDGAPPAAAPPAPTTVPWWEGGVLHVAGAEIPTRLREIVYAGGTTLVGTADAEGSRWVLVRDGELVPLVRSSSRVDPVLSDDGSRVVWVEDIHYDEVGENVADVTSRVDAYDVAAERRVGSWTTRGRVTCCDAYGALAVQRVLGDGSVLLYRLYQERMRWTPGRDPVEIAGQTEWSPTRPRSPDGHAVAFPANSDGQRGTYPADLSWVSRNGDLTRLDAPADSRIVAWEDDDHVVLATGRPVRFLRCTAATGACEETADRPGGRVRLPGDR